MSLFSPAKYWLFSPYTGWNSPIFVLCWSTCIDSRQATACKSTNSERLLDNSILNPSQLLIVMTTEHCRTSYQILEFLQFGNRWYLVRIRDPASQLLSKTGVYLWITEDIKGGRLKRVRGRVCSTRFQNNGFLDDVVSASIAYCLIAINSLNESLRAVFVCKSYLVTSSINCGRQFL